MDQFGSFLIVANRDSNQLNFLKIDLDSGLLQPTSIAADIPSPVVIRQLQLPFSTK
ncbi:beta-propeller fold lactonase family protein [Algoriphagus sp. D3-2-R+10]|uniref:beta-propeller fold lactonase family protein n=1 Tax=Algoriphagus aurantiacus TaxID=3103948 RepID=UPI003A5CB39D